MNRILMVEDDEKLRKELKIFLEKNGYEVECIVEFTDTISMILQSNANIILLDINLPNTDGQYICREVRKSSETPIIMITSKNTEMDELISLNYGADDYITKPFNTQILLAKIYAILKRTNKSSMNQNQIVYQDCIFNVSKGTLEKENRSIELTKNELKILYFLMQKKETIVSRDEIMSYLWDSQMFVDDNTLTVNMNRLRKKLEEIGLKDSIETKRGQGYLLK